jgi:translation elongation factor EF-1alpha
VCGGFDHPKSTLLLLLEIGAAADRSIRRAQKPAKLQSAAADKYHSGTIAQRRHLAQPIQPYL